MNRRTVLGWIAATPLVACRTESARRTEESSALGPPVRTSEQRVAVAAVEQLIRSVEPLGFQWKTPDPFLFCVHHDDAYPAGNDRLGPAASLVGRKIGSDFDPREGWRMYNGEVVPGFPQHPHRGFEPITIVRRGLVDHADSLGAAARYGGGDVQWLTAGKGIVHAEMFPLLETKRPNPLELFQIWLNLPSTDKLVESHFSMLWQQTIPKHAALDAAGKVTEVTIIAGSFGPIQAPAPPPKSWASRPRSDVAIWTLKMAPGARFDLPAAAPSSNRMLYFFRGKDLRIGERTIGVKSGIELRPDSEVPIENGSEECELLLLQGRPIAEPVAQHGPFVMNTSAEIQKAYADYRATRFGGWPWPSDGPGHDRGLRFARHADGRVEKAT